MITRLKVLSSKDLQMTCLALFRNIQLSNAKIPDEIKNREIPREMGENNQAGQQLRKKDKRKVLILGLNE